MAEGPILIKKYANRRLYDTRASHYITLLELAQIVRDGGDVRVVDAKTGEDLTRAVLLQVLLEDNERLDLLPIELLHHIIRIHGTLQAAPFARWLADAFGQWEALGKVMKQGLGASLAGRDPATAWMDAMRQATGWARPPSEAASAKSPPPPREEPAGPPSPEPSADAGLSDLRARMDDLLGKLKDR